MNINKYKFKKFSILGDSLSTLAGYNPPGYEVFYTWEVMLRAGIYGAKDTWWGMVIDELGGEILVNNSFSGSMVSKHPKNETQSYGCSDERTGGLAKDEIEPDVIMILLGTNDWGCGMKVMANFDSDGQEVFSVAYDAMLSKIKNNYPDAEIWCLTLPMSYCSRNPEFTPPKRFTGGYFDEYSKAIKICADKAGCRIIDIYHPEKPHDTIDGYHPTVQGMKTIADAVLAEVYKGGD